MCNASITYQALNVYEGLQGRRNALQMRQSQGDVTSARSTALTSLVRGSLVASGLASVSLHRRKHLYPELLSIDKDAVGTTRNRVVAEA
jgi:hypothetical protein